MSTVLARIVDITEQLKKQHITENEKNEVKNVIIDRIGCGLAAKRLGLGATVNNYGEQNDCGGESTIWGTMSKTQPHMAALVNGAISSHLEYDAHDSMVPSVLALGEQEGADGLSVITSMKIGSYTGLLLLRLIASGIEKRGMHWPAYISPFIAASACSSILGLSTEETANAIGIAASLSPAAPFESFTRGGSVKDLYGGWGNMVGVQAVQLSKLGLTGPDTLFEGERGLFRNWLGCNPDPETVDRLLDTSDIEMKFHIKPFPCCTAAHPTLTALSSLIKENPELDYASIVRVDVDTYRFGVDLSNESTAETPVGAKVNIPFLSASMLVHGNLLPEHSEEPWVHSPVITELAKRVYVECKDKQDELTTRKRSAKVKVTMKNGDVLSANAERSKWSNPRATEAQIIEKFKVNVGEFFPQERVDQIISTVLDIEKLDDIRSLTELLSHS